MFVKLLHLEGNAIGIMHRSVYLGHVSPGRDLQEIVVKLEDSSHSLILIQIANLFYVSWFFCSHWMTTVSQSANSSLIEYVVRD